MLKLRTDIPYVGQSGKFTQAGVEAIQGQIDAAIADASAGSAANAAAITAIQTTTSFVKRQTAVTAAGQTTLQQTGIPTWVNRVQAVLSLISTSGTSDLLLQVGDGAFVTTGYACNYQGFTGGATGTVTSTAGFIADIDNAANQNSGTITLERQTGNKWVATGIIRRDGSSLGMTVGEISLAGALDRIRLNTVGGTDTFDAGSVSFSWE
jgi:hypothetical protein